MYLSKLSMIDLHQRAKLLKYNKDSTGVLMAFGQGVGIKTTLFMDVITEIEEMRKSKVLNLMVNVLPAGVLIPSHIDYIPPTQHQINTPTVERWHLPIYTNPDAYFWTSINGIFHMPSGYWSGPIKYWKPHGVLNYGSTERVHLIVDMNTEKRLGEYD